ncbi:replication protein A 70 kDa DNA-binding subunit B-like isoform X2 [Coffea arabica]
MPMLLTLWNEFEANEGAQLANTIANNNIIIVMRVKVTTFNYLSLTTRLASCLLVNPPTSQATVLRQWYDQNRQQIAQLIEEGSYKDSTKLLPPPKNNDIISIENAVSMLKNVKTAWIRGNTSFAAEQRSFWYAACSNCQKAVDANFEWIIRCPSCREESAVEARCRIEIIIDDGTSSIYAVVFGTDAEKLIPFTAVQLSEVDEHGVEVFSEIASAIDNREVLCFVRHFDSDYQRQKDDKYSIIKIYTAEELAEINLAITRTVVSNPVEEPVPTAPTITEKPTSTIEHVDLTARSTVTNQLATEGQFFSPTTKMILDSIGRKSDNADKPASSNIAAKRSLTFETPPSAEKTTIETVPSIAGKNGSEDKKPGSSKSAHMSPLKKQRESAK